MSMLPSNPKELHELLQGTIKDESTSDIDTSTLRYILYARKSTTDEERQERSIPDQIEECMERVAKPRSLNVVEIIEENASAKVSDTRGNFRKMIDKIKGNEADAILSWHADRLSRNMKDAGEIIDLLDRGIIKDLQFATSSFENTPTGKMTLGISFVLSKQYSEHLSESVTRGNKRITEDGRFIGKYKHGYFIDSERRLQPDGENFIIIKNAFAKRLGKDTLVDIAKWLNRTNYTIKPRNKERTGFKWDKDSVSKLLRDPTYAGVLRYGNHVVNLSTHYDFEPVVSVEDFMSMNNVSSFNSGRLESSMLVKNPRTTKAKLLRGLVNCGHCNKPFASGITSKGLKSGKKYYYYYRCETVLCPFKNRSIRAKVVLNEVIEFFDQYRFTTQSNYKEHVRRAEETNKKRSRKLSSHIAELMKVIALKEEKYENAKDLLAKNPSVEKHYDLDSMQKELKRLEAQFKKATDRRKALKGSVITYEKYLELIGSASVTIPKIHDIELMNNVLGNFFLNFTVTGPLKDKKQGYKIEFKLKEPWKGFLISNDFDRGRGDHTVLA